VSEVKLYLHTVTIVQFKYEITLQNTTQYMEVLYFANFGVNLHTLIYPQVQLRRGKSVCVTASLRPPVPAHGKVCTCSA